MRKFRSLLTTGIVLGFLFPLSAQFYPVILIPDSLKTGAGAVVRDYSVTMEVSSGRWFTMKVHEAVTVLNKSGEAYSALELYYDKFTTPGEIQISLFEGNNLSPRKVKQSEIVDQAVDRVGTLFSDNRVKWFKPAVNAFPFTIIYDYEIKHDGYLHLPVFMPVQGYGLAVQKASLRLSYEADNRPEIREMNFEHFGIHSERSGTTYTCEVRDFPAITDEPLSPDLREVSPVVYFFPQHVEFDGSRADFTSWNGFGIWQHNLLAGRDLLPEKTRLLVHALTDTVKEPKIKARLLYEYMQSRMRYVGIQLGIGGFQPFSAEVVDKTGYGDCKALSNFYRALLKEAGIPSDYAITKLGEGKAFFLPDLTSNIYFNHAMVCIPFTHDTTWVECTSQFVPFGYVGSHSEGKPAILIHNQGAEIVSIHGKNLHPDRTSRNYRVKLYADGSARVEFRTDFSGKDMSEGLEIFEQSHKEQEEYLYKSLRLTNLEISSFAIGYEKEKNRVELNCVLICSKLGSVSGKRLLLQGLMPSDIIGVPDNVTVRKLPVEISEAIHESDTLSFVFDAGISIESIPKSVNLETKFGRFFIEYETLENGIQVRSGLQIWQAEYPKEDYRELRDFIIAIQKAEKQKILLKLA